MDEFIDKKTLSFIVPVLENNQNYTLYIPAPSKERADNAAPILGSLFSLKENSGLSPLVLSRDYEVYARRASKQLAKEITKDAKNIEAEENILFNNFKNFIEASMLSAQVIMPDLKTVSIIDSKLSETSLEYATGLFVFFYITMRYASMILSETEKKAFITSLSILEYIKSLQTQS